MSSGVREVQPRQPHASQIADAGFLLALVFLSLFLTTFVLADDGASGGPASVEVAAIADLPISEAEKAQFVKMEEAGMVDAEAVAAAVDANQPSDDKYSFSWLALGGTVALALAYLVFVYAMSFKEYREVVGAKFGPAEGTAS